MINDLLIFYKKNLTFNSLIFKYYSKWQKAIFGGLILGCSALFIFAFYLWNVYIGGAGVLLLLVFTLYTKYISSKIIAKCYPECEPSTFDWSNEKLNKIKQEKFNQYLLENGIINNIPDLQVIIEKKIKNERYPFILQNTVFGALFLSLWNNTTSVIMTSCNTDLKLIAVLFFCFLGLIMVIAIYALLFYTIMEDSLKYKELYKISEMLDEYRIIGINHPITVKYSPT